MLTLFLTVRYRNEGGNAGVFTLSLPPEAPVDMALVAKALQPSRLGGHGEEILLCLAGDEAKRREGRARRAAT